MKFNEKILKQKEDLEAQVRQMQEDTHKMDERYKELSTLQNEFSVIKKNEITIPAELQKSQDDQIIKERRMSNASSELSQEVSMMIDVTDLVGDNDEDGEYHDHDVFDTSDET